MSISVKEINTDEFGHCVLITDKKMNIVVTIDYGPRIVSVTSGDKPNLIYHETSPEIDRCHGHKMRLTLERASNGVYFDNSPVMYTLMEDGVKLIQTVKEPIRLELSMDIMPNSETESLMIAHSVVNKSKEPVKLSIYTETPLLHSGFVFVPQNTLDEPDKPQRILMLWNNTQWTDRRLHIGDQYITVMGNETSSKLKIGLNNTAGLCGYIYGNDAFIKHYIHNKTALYPFSHCSTAVTAHENFLSIQTASPFYVIDPGEAARHVENWRFLSTEHLCSPDNETSVDRLVQSI